MSNNNDSAGGSDSNPRIKDVDAVFSGIPNESTVFTFSKGSVAAPNGGHLQGLQAINNGSLYVLSGSSDTEAYLMTVDRPSLMAIEKINITRNNLPHAGGFQVIGNYLVVGLEHSKNKGSVVLLYEVNGSSLLFNRKLVTREGSDTAGAVGIVKLESGEFLMVVSTWDSENVDIYKSDKEPLGQASCTFGKIGRWNKESADKSRWIDDNWGSYQNLNLVLGSDKNVYMFAFNKSGNNYVDLYSIHLDADNVEKYFLKRAKKQAACHPRVNFRFGAGIWIRDPNNITLLASERTLEEYTRINLF